MKVMTLLSSVRDGVHFVRTADVKISSLFIIDIFFSEVRNGNTLKDDSYLSGVRLLL
jgi:hypothetical protein